MVQTFEDGQFTRRGAGDQAKGPVAMPRPWFLIRGVEAPDAVRAGLLEELADGAAHSLTPMPVVLAGSAGNYFRTGRFVTYSDRSHNDLLVSILNAMEVPATTFGMKDVCTGPLPNLT